MPLRSFRLAALRLAAGLMLALLAAAPAAALTEEVRETFPLAAGGSFSLDNVNGDVDVEGWDRDEVEIVATKHAGDAEMLAELEVDFEATADRVRVRTRYPRHESRGGWFRSDHLEVEYTIRVPRGARLEKLELVNGSLQVRGVQGSIEASLVNGDLRGVDLGGDLDLDTVNGRLEVELGSLGAARDLRLESVNGKVVLAVPRDGSLDVRASTVHGSIRNDFGLEVEKDGPVGREMRGRVGSGTVRVDLETVNGSIDLRSR